MEYVPGLPSDRVLSRGDWASLIFVATQVCHGLEALQRAGVVHGDLKPSNILVVPDATSGKPASVRLLDFGLSNLMGRDGDAVHGGSIGFAAPEIMRGLDPSLASDSTARRDALRVIAGRPPLVAEDAQGIVSRLPPGRPSGVVLEKSARRRRSCV